MKALLIVGHAGSDYQLVEELLCQQGMGQIKPSRRESLTPIEIGKKLLKTQGIEFADLTDFDQLEAGEIWNELALDLLLANVEQPFWGWADPQTVVLLDYWRKVEPQLKFLLLYDSPEIVLSRVFANQSVDKETLAQAIEQWHSFYEAILHFYHRNEESCLLVHIGVIREKSTFLAEKVARFMQYTLPEGDYIDNENVSDNPIDFSVDQTAQWLMANLLEDKDYASVYTFYEALQAVADVPLVATERFGLGNALLAWDGYQQPVERYKEEDDINSEKTFLVKELEKENELLLLHLHQVQEKLERCFLENKKLKNSVAIPPVSTSSSSFYNSQPNGSSFYYGAADRIKQQLSYRLGATMLQQSRTLRGILMMPWSLIKETRAFRKDFNARKHEKLPPISGYQDAYEAERVKQHLSYRLGHTLVKNTNSVMGWIKLPWLLRQEVVDFQKRRGH